MGVVYEAFDRERGSTVALKTLRRSPDGNNIYRFKAEFRLLQELRHPNLIRLHELHNEGDSWFFTMEIVDGVDFLEWVRPSGTAWTEMESPASGAGSLSSGTGWPLLGDENMKREPASLSGSGNELMTTGSMGLVAPQAGGLIGYKGLKVDRLRDSMAQLCRGLSKLHRAGKVHRDIKPSNVLVTHDGRVVVLDFGLVTIADTKAVGEQVVGTPAYMAPEQAAERAVGPEADWYSVGVLLYQALTEKLPFEGLPLQMLMQKQMAEAPSPAALVPGTPPELGQLCEGLLNAQPERRISGSDVLRRLGADMGAASRRRARATPVATQTVFVGRGPELEKLNLAHKEASQEKKGNVYFLLGESGVGKSALVRHFASTTAASNLVFAGRCYQNESVPYKAFDGIIDALSEYMAGRPEVEAAALVPRDASLLLKAFPVLARVTALGQAPAVSDEALHPQEVRTRVFDALAELLSRLAARHPVLLIVDDLQWADADSFALIERVLGRADAPPLMLLATIRAGADQSNVNDLAASLTKSGRLRQQHIDPLPEYDALELAKRLLGGNALGASAGAIASEASGHPLFIEALARHAASGESGQGPLKLEEALCASIVDLPDASRELLSLVAVAGRPISKKTLARAAELTMEQLLDQVELLRGDKLVRVEGTRQEDAVEAYHGRVQDAALLFDIENRPAQHRRLALAFEGDDQKDCDALYTHWCGAGDKGKALTYAELAGDQAAETLAFDRAVRLYREANSLAETPTAPLLAKLAESLVNIGRSAEAAEVYQQAAELAEESDRRVDMLHRAATLFLKSGHVDKGVALLRPALAAMGLSFPKSQQKTILSALSRRAWMKLSKPQLRFTKPAPKEVSVELERAIQVCFNTTLSFALFNHALFLFFASRHQSLAVSKGTLESKALALLGEANIMAASGASKKTSALWIERGKYVMGNTSDPYMIGATRFVEGNCAYLYGDWLAAKDALKEARDIFTTKCEGATWEAAFCSLDYCWSLAYMGEFKELEKTVKERYSQATERGDVLGQLIHSTGFPNIVWLGDNSSHKARELNSLAGEGWSQSGFYMQHMLMLFGDVQLDLIEGKGSIAKDRLEAKWKQLKKSGLLMLEFNRILMFELKARTLLASGSSEKEISKCLRPVRKAKRPWATGLYLLASGQAAISSNEEKAKELLREAAFVLFQANMVVHSVGARLLVARLEGNTEEISVCEERIRVLGCPDPSRYMGMLLPKLRSNSLLRS